jgi:hypothetical protein
LAAAVAAVEVTVARGSFHHVNPELAAAVVVELVAL